MPPVYLNPAAGTKSSASFPVTVQRQLLLSARALLDGGYPAAAVVAAQTANEVFIERTLARLFELRKIEHLWADVGNFIPSYNIARDDKKLLRLYATLTEDSELTKQPFWLGDSVSSSSFETRLCITGLMPRRSKRKTPTLRWTP
jgi:hypothetical protein